jgi:hypothetical protein
MAAGEDGALAALKEFAGDLVPEEGKINEMVCWQLTGDVSKANELELIFKVATPFEAGAKVTLLIGISPADGDVEWLKLY